MIIRNISMKVIGIAGKDLMPDATVSVPDKAVNGPIKRLADMGLLRLVKEKPQKKVEVKEEPDEEPAFEPVEDASEEPAEVAPKRRTRKKAKAEEEPAE